MNAHDQLERQLRANVAGAVRRRRRPTFRAVMAAGTVVVTAAVILVAVLASGSGSRATLPAGPAMPSIGPKPPNPGPIPHDVNDAVIAGSVNRADREDRACGGSNPVRGVDEGSPSPGMLSTLPALTRLKSPPDLPDRPMVNGQAPIGRVYVHYLRLARRVGQTDFYLEPVADLGQQPLSVRVANHCYALTVAALDAQIPRLPAGERNSIRRYGDAVFALDRYDFETSQRAEAVWLYSEQPAGGSAYPSTVAQIRQGRSLSIGPTSITGIVPGGVAAVGFVLHHDGMSVSMLVSVVNDVVVARIPAKFRGARLSRAVFESASGSVLKTITDP